MYFPMNLLERSVLWGRGDLYHICVFFLLVPLFINLVISLFVYLFILIFINFFYYFFYFINHRQAMAYPTGRPWPTPWPTPGFVPTRITDIFLAITCLHQKYLRWRQATARNVSAFARYQAISAKHCHSIPVTNLFFSSYPQLH